MSNTHYYDLKVNWTSDRRGIMSSSVLDSKIEVATPPEFPNGIPNVWSPEHFFLAAVNSCLMTTFLAIADKSKLNFSSFESNSIGKLEIVDGKYMLSEIELLPTVIIADENERAKTLMVLEKSEAHCLISNSIKSKIIFSPKVIVEEKVA